MLKFFRKLLAKDSKKPTKIHRRYHFFEKSAQRQYVRLSQKGVKNLQLQPQSTGKGWEVTWETGR